MATTVGLYGSSTLESTHLNAHPLVSWRSVVAGFVVTLLTLATLISLGMAFGGLGLSDGTTAQNAGLFTGIWFLISAILSLAAGSYFAARISRFHMNRLGAAQGLVIAALFFGLFLYQSFSAIGFAGRTAGTVAGGAAMTMGAGVSQAADSPVVNDIVENAIGDLNLRSDARTVVTGVAGRLLRGDTEGAKTYLARQAGISPEEADTRIAQLRAQTDQALIQARETTARALQATGWTLFAMMVLGSAAAVGGGALGSLANTRRPLALEQVGHVNDFAAQPV